MVDRSRKRLDDMRVVDGDELMIEEERGVGRGISYIYVLAM